MAFMNLLKASYTGKLGETVGQGWNDQKIIRTYQEKKTSNSEEQKKQKDIFLQAMRMASVYWQTRYNLKPPSNYKGNAFNYFYKALFMLVSQDSRNMQPVKAYCTSPKPIVFRYMIVYNNKIYFVFNRSIIGNPKDIIEFEWKTCFMEDATEPSKQWIPPKKENAILDISFPAMASILGFSKHFLYDTGFRPRYNDVSMFQVDVKTKTKVFQSMFHLNMLGLDFTNQIAVPNE